MFDAGVERALRAAEQAHRGQARKGLADSPYFLHPVHVALILARAGEEPHVLQAAILHDVVEDCQGWSVARVEREFGPHVAAIVAELSEDKSKSWEERKRGQVERAAEMERDALAVKAADKLHNLRTLAESLRAAQDPSVVWSRFKGGRDRTLAHARELVEAVAKRLEGPLAAELRAALADAEAAALRPSRDDV